MVSVEALKVGYGDCIFVSIEYDNGRVFTIMMDGGLKSAYRTKDKKGRLAEGSLKRKLNQLRDEGKAIDLLIITHVDQDHIGGIMAWFAHDFPKVDFVKRIWMNDDVEIKTMNSLDNSTGQAASLIKLLDEKKIKYENQLVAGKEFCFDWGRISILAPMEAHHNTIAKEIGNGLNNNADEEYTQSIKTCLQKNGTWMR